MKSFHFKFPLLIIGLIVSWITVRGDETKTLCLVFSGPTSTPTSLDLSIYSSIEFSEDDIIVLPIDKSYDPVVLSFSDYNYLQFKDAVHSGIKDAISTIPGTPDLYYDSVTKTINYSGIDVQLEIRIFDMFGNLMKKELLSEGEGIYVGSLQNGIYVAVYKHDANVVPFKFIIH